MTGGRLNNVLCAPDSFKGTLSAVDAAAAMAEGVAGADSSIACDRCPVADGGEGSLEVLAAAMGGSIHETAVTGPLGEPVTGRYAIVGEDTTGVVELAEASGLGLVPEARRDPTRTTTFGTGRLIAAAVAGGCGTIIVCIGGSATVDGGAGIAQALGGRFLDSAGRPLEGPLSGARLIEVAAYEPPPSPPRIRVACDVANPLCGPRGAAAVYGPQKGATPEQVEMLDEALGHLSSVVGVDGDFPGAGAAGGAGWGLVALLGAELQGGIDLVLEAVGFCSRCAAADLVLTGEGSLDEQSLHGKACVGVARAAGALGVPVMAIAGRVTRTGEFDALFARVVDLSQEYGQQRSMADTAQVLADATAELIRSL